MGKNSALLMFDPDRLIGKLISNIVLSMREKHWLMKGINMFRRRWKKKKKSVASSTCRGTDVPHPSGVQVAGRDCKVTDLGMYISDITTGRVL